MFLIALVRLLIGQAFPPFFSLQKKKKKKKGLNIGFVLLQSFEIGANVIHVVVFLSMHANVGTVKVEQACVGLPTGHLK